MSKIIEIGGKNFEYMGTVCAEPIYGHLGIYDCYNNPSETKIAIWEAWKHFFHEVVGTYDYTISGYNCDFFTISVKFNWEGKRYYARITHKHNYLYELV